MIGVVIIFISIIVFICLYVNYKNKEQERQEEERKKSENAYQEKCRREQEIKNRIEREMKIKDVRRLCDGYGIREAIIQEILTRKIPYNEVLYRIDTIEDFIEKHPNEFILYGDYILYSGEELKRKLDDTLIKNKSEDKRDEKMKIVKAKTNAEFLNKEFGTNYTAWMKCGWAFSDDCIVWMVPFDDKVNCGWLNTIEDENTVVERFVGKESEKLDTHKILIGSYRIVVKKERDKGIYKILGLYKYDKQRMLEPSLKEIRRWKKISDYTDAKSVLEEILKTKVVVKVKKEEIQEIKSEDKPNIDLTGVNVGTIVLHKIFGEGKIVDIVKTIGEKHIRVVFQNEERKFVFPHCFLNGYLMLK